MAAFEGHVGLVLCARDPLLHIRIAAPGYRIAVAKGGQEGFLPTLKHLPGVAVGLAGGVVGVHRYQSGKGPGAGFVFLARKGRIIGAHFIGAQLAEGAGVYDPCDGEPRAVQGEVLPYFERWRRFLVAGGQHAVADHDGPKPVGIFRGQPQP